jgi:hypothetical protein
VWRQVGSLDPIAPTLDPCLMVLFSLLSFLGWIFRGNCSFARLPAGAKIILHGVNFLVGLLFPWWFWKIFMSWCNFFFGKRRVWMGYCLYVLRTKNDYISFLKVVVVDEFVDSIKCVHLRWLVYTKKVAHVWTTYEFSIF